MGQSEAKLFNILAPILIIEYNRYEVINMEVWKDIDGFNGVFQVSNEGRVRSVDRIVEQKSPKGGLSIRKLKGKILKHKLTTFGYFEIRLYNRETGKHKDCRVHQLVAKAFIPNPENKPQVNHKDADKQNNRVENLEWVTPQENMTHAHNGLIHYRFGEKHQNTKITEEDVRFIREHYSFRNKEYNTTTLAKKYGVSLQTILNIVNRKTWKHIE
jgi:hypothetical protein